MSWEQFQYEYLSFDGRINRWPYFWKPMLLGLAVSFFLMICEMLLPMAIVSVLFKVAPVFNVIVTSSFIVRRCHDLDKSGYWGLLVLIPIVNFFFLLYLLFLCFLDSISCRQRTSLTESRTLKHFCRRMF